MATPEGIIALFDYLISVDYRPSARITGNLDAAVRTWTLTLGDVDDEDLLQAAVTYARSGAEFFPKPGQLIQLVPRPAELSADEAWGALLALVRRHGSYTPPEKVAHLTEGIPETALLAVGGWRALCMLHDDQLVATRASFRNAYTAAMGRETRALELKTARALIEERPRMMIGTMGGEG